MGQAKRRGSFEARAAGAARNMVGITNQEAYEFASRREDRAAGCLAVAVCGIGIAACAALGLLLAGPCRRETRPGPDSLAANIAAGIYGDELADAGGL